MAEHQLQQLWDVGIACVRVSNEGCRSVRVGSWQTYYRETDRRPPREPATRGGGGGGVVMSELTSFTSVTDIRIVAGE